MIARTGSCVVVLLSHIWVASVSTAALLSNGDFETGDLSGWSWQPTDHAEPQMTTDVVDFNTTTTGASRAFRVNPGGDQSYASGSYGGGTLWQDVFLTAGETYQITMDVAARCMLPLPNNTTGKISLYIGDVQISTFGPDFIEGNAVTRASFSGTFVPQVSDDYLVSIVFLRQFGNFSTPDYPTPRIYDYVDNVSLVPEPALLALLTVGGLMLLA